MTKTVACIKQFYFTKFCFLLLTLFLPLYSQATTGALTGTLAGETPTALSTDPYTKVPRGYLTPDIKDLGNGKYEIQVDVFYEAGNTDLQLNLEAVIDDGTGKKIKINVPAFPSQGQVPLLSRQITNKVDHTGKQLFATKHSIIIDANDINNFLRQAMPNAPGIAFAPCSSFFVHGNFRGGPATSAGHNWGSTDRGGLIVVPGPCPSTPTVPGKVVMGRATDLDITHPAPVSQFPGVKGNVSSKVEMEGKYAVKDLAAFQQVQDQMLKLARDPQLAEQLLGQGWKVEFVDRYIPTDPTLVSPQNPKGYVLDSRGVPISPMNDVITVDPEFIASKNDVTVRERSGNGTTVHNVKSGGPNGYRVTPEGIVYRLETQLETVKPGIDGAVKYLSSNHVTNVSGNIMRSIGLNAEDVRLKSVALDQNRLKFLVKGPNGEEIEVSTDHYKARSLLNPNAPQVEQFGIEMDAGHLATVRKAQPGNAYAHYQMGIGALNPGQEIATIQGTKLVPTATAANLTNNAFLDGKPIVHVLDDIKAGSPLMVQNAQSFADLEAAILKIANFAAPDRVFAGNKAATANALLGHLGTEADVSPSLRTQFTQMRAKGWTVPTIVPDAVAIAEAKKFGAQLAAQRQQAGANQVHVQQTTPANCAPAATAGILSRVARAVGLGAKP